MEHNKKLTSRAQKLCRNMTKEERRLWYEYLRGYQHQFRRQVTFGNYIMDFYCAAAKLAVELDGSQHYQTAGKNYDESRTAYLNGLGIYVLRFSNTEVMGNLSGVCQKIDMTVYERINTSLREVTSPAPLWGHPPQRGGQLRSTYGTKKEGTRKEFQKHQY